MSSLKLFVESALVGFIAYPIVKYVVVKFGDVLWQDVKNIAYKVWDKVKFKA